MKNIGNKNQDNADDNNSVFKSLFQDNFLIMLLINPENGQIIDANKSACKFYGYSHDKIIQLNINQINTLSESEIKQKMQNAITATKNEFVFKHKLSNGQIKDVEVHSGKINYFGKNVLYSTIYDITEKKKTERKLKIVETKLTRFLNNFPGICFIKDAEHRYIFANKEYENVFKLPPNWKNKTGTELNLHPTEIIESLEANDKIVLQNNEEIKIIEKVPIDNKLHHWLIVKFPLNNKKEKFVAGVGIDITQRVETEIELEHAKEKAEESDKLKTEFLNNLSHEIRTPMNAILGYTNIVKKQGTTQEKRNKYSKIVQDSGEQLLQIIDDILEFSELNTRQAKIRTENVDIKQIFRDLKTIYHQKALNKNLKFHVKDNFTENEIFIFTDKPRLKKILEKLIENALKFTEDGFIEIGYSLTNNNIEFYIKDTGIGIDKNKQEKIFECFSQAESSLSRKFGGLGLGLSIIKKNIELLNGKINLQTEKGKGTTFFFTIPYNQINTEQISKRIDGSPTKNKRDDFIILIAEDEEINYFYIETLIEDINLNLTLLHARNGKEAVEICKDIDNIDLVLMDIKMPIMNGYEATKEIKKLKPDLKIIAQTSYTMREDIEKAKDAGCDDFLSKPISEETMTEILNKYLLTN